MGPLKLATVAELPAIDDFPVLELVLGGILAAFFGLVFPADERMTEAHKKDQHPGLDRWRHRH
jgi:hypothetical protein